MWLWIELESHEACLKLQSNKEMSWYFTQLKHIHHSFVLDERVVWIEISGLPLNAWTPKAFKKIDNNWGSPFFIDEDPNEIVSAGRVCIKTKIHGHINENCKVVILGKSHSVSIKEFVDWNPDIKDMDLLSSNNSERDHSEKHEDNLSDNGFQDKEDGAIPNGAEFENKEEEYVKNTQWPDGAEFENLAKKQEDPFAEFQHSPKIKIKVQKEDSNSFSKPPGFKAYNSNNKITQSRKSLQSPKQPSHFSSAPVKTSRVSKSQSKSFNNHGSMIDAFVSHIEMGKVLGYDMEGSKNDLNKFIDSLGANQECPSNGRSGGLVSIWDPNVFQKINDFNFKNLLIVEGKWIASHIHCFMINVYPPQDANKKEMLWNEISEFMDNNRGHHLIFGDFNEGIKIEGHWIEDPLRIKDAFHTFYDQKFQKIEVVKIVNRSPSYKSLNNDQNIFLDSSVSVSEIKNAIWDCGSDKSPGPDSFTFAFYKEYWNMIQRDVVEFVHHFLNSGSLPRGCNTSFITLILKVPNPMVISDFRPISHIRAQYKIIAKVLANRLARVIDTIISQEQSAFIKHRQILDGPLMFNEVIQWCKNKKSKLMVFKIDFEKAFDSISWDFLFQVMHFMGFSKTWIKWISGCLNSASSSILINGTMEGLDVAMKDAMVAGFYNGFKIDTLNLSHLFFVDEALFIGEWSHNNIKSLVAILDCFHQVSGLKINYHKSKLFGVGDPFEEVTLMASITECNALVSPFNYLGLPIDCNMALVKRWDPIYDKFSKRLSKWKASLLSIGGRATLITSVLGAIGTYFFSLFPMPLLKMLGSGLLIPLSSRLKVLVIKLIGVFFPVTVLELDGIETSQKRLTSLFEGPFVIAFPADGTSVEKELIFHSLDSMSSSKKDILEVVCGVTLWSLWSFRNEVIFGTVHPKRSMLFDKIVDYSFRWYSTRRKLSSISWNNWIQNPLVVYSL
nr:RNA-directed DNA polymerase, eukaryota [Tanacetum cinerariifolium]